MVKVKLGELSGERAGGYEFYRTGNPTGEGQTIRRTAAVTPFQLGGGTQFQTAHNFAFTMANVIYNGFSDLEKCFYRGWNLRIEKHEFGKARKLTALTGKALAIHDILDNLEHTHTPYLKPLGFCVCAIDENDNPIPYATLTVRSEKLGIFTYTGESDLCGCFPACSVAPKYEPYTLTCGMGEYGPLTAQEVHDLRYLCVTGLDLVFYRASYGRFVFGYDGHLHFYPTKSGIYRVQCRVKSKNQRGGSACIYIGPDHGPNQGFDGTKFTEMQYEHTCNAGQCIHIESHAWWSDPQVYFYVEDYRIYKVSYYE